MVAGHGDEQGMAMERKIPGTVEGHLQGRPALATRVAFFTVAGQRAHRLLLQVERPDEMVLAIGNIKDAIPEGQALRIVENGRSESSIRPAGEAVLIDFGCATARGVPVAFEGSYPYMPPEAYRYAVPEEWYTPKSVRPSPS